MKHRLFCNGSWLFAIVALCLFISCNSGGAGNGDGDNNPPIAPEPPVADALEGLQFFEGWTDARKLADPINTVGWENSAFISYDGSAWSTPTKIQGIPADGSNAWQVFVQQEGVYLYWSGACPEQ